jgi:predicted DNA-binding protein (UPF0251 family)
MPRPKCWRWIGFRPGVTYYKPRGVPLRFLKEVRLTQDELEALRLADYQGKEQKKAAQEMRVSQSTLQRILTTARQKVSQGLVEGRAIRIEGGRVKMRRG